MRGQELRSIRRKLEWTQRQLAEALGVTSNTVARWERDERSISAPVVRLIRFVFAARKPTWRK
jgi:transcriptional regulator with XRE-family HTH domain